MAGGNKSINWSNYLCAERWRKEDPADPIKDRRNPFEVDFGKVIFCPAIRRMHDKTQVIPLSSGDCVLTRLTHSLQVMNIAESLACNYTRSESFQSGYEDLNQAFEDAQSIRAILKTAALLHDIGNPPFGHFGEDTIKEYFTNLFKENSITGLSDAEKMDFEEFDGNAEGFRIVSKLQYTGTLDGLNLTYGTLGAYLKYPNSGKQDKKGYVGNHKHGIFVTEQDLFNQVVEKCHLNKGEGKIKRHPLAFLVEAADTICYATMDVEDGLYQGWYSICELLNYLNSFIQKKIGDESFSIEKMIGFNLQTADDKQKDHRLVRLELRECLITYLVNLAIQNFISNAKDIESGEYSLELVYQDNFFVADALKEFTFQKILSNNHVLKFEITGNSVITGLFEILIKYFFHTDKSYRSRVKGVIAPSRLEESMKEFVKNNYSENEVLSPDMVQNFDVSELPVYARLRLIVDYVASMTDKYSVELYQTLSGNSL